MTPDDSPPPALRLTFRAEPDGIVLVSARPFPGRVPPSDPTGAMDDRAGFWCELRDAGGQVLFRRVLADPGAPREVFANDGGPSITRAPNARPTGLFVVLVPVPEAPATVALCAGGGVELASFTLPEGK